MSHCMSVSMMIQQNYTNEMGKSWNIIVILIIILYVAIIDNILNKIQ